MIKKSSIAFKKSYEYIRDQILNGELPRGTKLIEEKLAEEIGVSRTPVRESIRRLEQEGLIQQKRVVNPSETDLRNLFQVRILLEGFAARSAAQFLREEDLGELRECVRIGRSGNAEEIMTANERFHDLIVQSTHNPFMIDTIARMHSIIYLFRKTVVYHKRPFLIDEHEQICQAIAEHQGELAERLMQEHLQADLEFCIHLLK
ncbi:GntR family transcriptional regulator [Paenibacillus lemnae]|uniref:GntR family transcriptional regulator n=1 Tax=Paenibacillus lemnae TaxID=1330551 RepID=A0A848M3D2_PAELE|nr:GntR family transcriptional regulator [Paenibacillus lemnae]NMO94353.1 GntR family transcriptional regulator [Paenibacillus lemnae]